MNESKPDLPAEEAASEDAVRYRIVYQESEPAPVHEYQIVYQESEPAPVHEYQIVYQESEPVRLPPVHIVGGGVKTDPVGPNRIVVQGSEDDEGKKMTSDVQVMNAFTPIRAAMPAEQWQRVYFALLPILDVERGGDAVLYAQLLEANAGGEGVEDQSTYEETPVTHKANQQRKEGR